MTVTDDSPDPLVAATALFCDYAVATDEARTDDFAALFSEDGVFFSDDIVGRKAIASHCAMLLSRMERTSHHISNVRVLSVEGGEAKVDAYVYAWHVMNGGEIWEVWGRYFSTLRRVDGRWLFADHRIRSAGVRPDHAFPTSKRLERTLL